MNERIKIAIADDHALFRRGMVSLLQMNDDFEVILEASNGQELIDALETNLPDVILMDLQMPVLDGIRATEQIKNKHTEIKIIVISMHDEDQFVSHLMELGANGYLLKDADPDEVEKAIRVVATEDYYYGAFLLKVMHNRMLSKPVKKDAPRLSVKVDLSERELEVLKYICEGMSTPQIAEKIFLSPRTVEGHRNRIMEKTGTKNVAGMVAWAVRNGIC
ncbi:DNA-binding response regulator, NarL/FixJ family, contains REC and HTH domains [Pseudarcicella hirudinis]|uniref:DNA-binding response regulator, NarL/FixJ family, contains REC and HTH domains n=1 Tax=Pseudarcicella hirudinis TaxID=1079859 RepID=A0A1I5NX97_9BACT|nr:response regulator transcription factor [Pseudarcicella hirudinis]SFP26405.1 DNA-binding response regulator, NarL/FixJ family, contains REC and HTH domains [Pseudarcicella hirudinis]